MKFPMPSFNLGMGIMRWAEELRKWADSISSALNGLDGRNGQDGTPGTSGCDCHDWIDLTVAGGGTTVLTDEYRNKTIYVKNSGGGSETITLPASLDGDYLVILNRSATTEAAYRFTVEFGTDGPLSLIVISGGGCYCRDNGKGGWLYVSLSTGIASAR